MGRRSSCNVWSQASRERKKRMHGGEPQACGCPPWGLYCFRFVLSHQIRRPPPHQVDILPLPFPPSRSPSHTHALSLTTVATSEKKNSGSHSANAGTHLF